MENIHKWMKESNDTDCREEKNKGERGSTCSNLSMYRAF